MKTNITKSIILYYLALVSVVTTAAAGQGNDNGGINREKNELLKPVLVINVNTNVWSENTPIALDATITNVSTNQLFVVESGHTFGFTISINGKSGEKYDLVPGAKSEKYMRITFTLNPGDVYRRSLPLKWDHNIKQGEYELTASHDILTKDGRKFKVVSNAITLKVE